MDYTEVLETIQRFTATYLDTYEKVLLPAEASAIREFSYQLYQHFRALNEDFDF